MKTQYTVRRVVHILGIASLCTLFCGSCSQEQAANPISSVAPSTEGTSTPPADAAAERLGAPPTAAAVPWSSMTQAERNMSILYRADRDNGKYVGLNCKEWARRVVADASGGIVVLPQTLPDASGWYFAYSRHLVGMSGGIRSVGMGWIVQMQWRLNNGTITPHTFIIAGRSPSGITVIESNWCANSCMRVAYRYISFSEFDAHVVRYTCYYVTGG